MIQVVVIIRILHLNMSSFMNNSHDLIKRSQTYTLDRKSISIHSEDRDTSKYKNSNSFEVTLPETLRNVQTMCLAEISLPTNLYTFSNSYQNTKFKFSLNPAEVVDSLSTEYDVLHNYYLNDNYFTAQITSGSYTPLTFASEIQMQMNNEVSHLIKESLHDIPASGSLGFIGNGVIGTEVTADIYNLNDMGTVNNLSYVYQWQISDDLSSGSWNDITGFSIDTSQVNTSLNNFVTALGSVSVIGGGESITWSISDTDLDGSDVTVSNQGILSLNSESNYMNKKSYFFTVQAEDTDLGLVATSAIAINVINLNTSPAILDSSSVASTIDEGEKALGSVSSDIKVIWSVLNPDSDVVYDGIDIDESGILQLSNPASYALQRSYSFTVKAVTEINEYVTYKSLTVNVNKGVIAKVIIDTDNVLSTIQENVTDLGYVTASGDQQVVWSVTSNDVNSDVSISSSGGLTIGTSSNYPTKHSYSFTVEASINDDVVGSKALAINVANPNTSEGIIDSSNVAETLKKGDTEIGKVAFSTNEVGETVEWSIVNDNSSSSNSVTISSQGDISLNEPAEYGTQSSYLFTVIAQVSLSSSTEDNPIHYIAYKSLAVNVNVEEVIIIDGSNIPSTINNFVTAIGSVSASGNGNEFVTWSIVEDSSSPSDVVISQKGLISLKSSSNYENKKSYFFTVKATLSNNVEGTLSFAVNVDNLNTNPAVIDTSAVIPIVDNGEISIGSVSSDIPVTWSILGSSSDVIFSSNDDKDGILTVSPAANYTVSASYFFTVKATTTDGNSYVSTHAIAVNVNDTNSSTNNKYRIPNNTDISSSRKYIRLQVSATDSNDSTTAFYSGYTEIIDQPTSAPPSPIIAGVISFSQDATEGKLIADTSNMNVLGVTNPKLEYQWQVAVTEDVSGFVALEGATLNELDYNSFKDVLNYHNYIRLYVSVEVEGTTLTTASGYVSIIHGEYVYNNFQVHYDIISQELFIGNNRDDFELNFDIQCDYEGICSSGQQLMWDKSRNWGLPYNMGFEKETYDSNSYAYKKISTGIQFANELDLWLVPDTSDSPLGSFVQSQYFVSPFPINVHWGDSIYMELEKYNSVDELLPYSPVAASLQSDANCVCTYGVNAIVKRGSPAANKIYIHPASKMYRPEDGNNCSPVNICSRCKNKVTCPTPYSNVGGIVNAAFAKIPHSLSPTSPSGTNYRRLAAKGEIQGVSTFAPPLDTISKLKVKFRLHDGRLVDFGNMKFDFTLSVGTLVDEIASSYEVRVPSEYYM